MCYYDLAISSSRLSNLSCKLLDHYLLSACMPHVTGHFCVCHVELWLLFHDFFPVPGYLFLDLDLGTWVPGYLGTWVPGYLGNQGTREPVPWFPLYGSREPQGEPQGEPHGNHRGTTGGTTREPVPWFPPYGSREPVPGSPVPGSEMTGSPKFWFQYEYFPIYYYREFIFQYFTHRWKQPEGKHFFPRAKPEGKNASPRAVSTCK